MATVNQQSDASTSLSMTKWLAQEDQFDSAHETKFVRSIKAGPSLDEKFFIHTDGL